MIRFPKPLNWFQKKFWRIRWLEWIIILLILSLPSFNFELLDKPVDVITILVYIPIMALMFPYVFGFMYKLVFVWFPKFMDSVGGMRIFGYFADLFEKIGDIVNNINNGILSIFCEEEI